MCDYSLAHLTSRSAVVGETLVTTNFGTGTRGFAAPEDARTPVCVLPGTELAFEKDISTYAPPTPRPAQEWKTAIFRQVNKDNRHRHHDALELPCGTVLLLTSLEPHQLCKVLQLPKMNSKEEIEATKRLEVIE